MKLQAVPSSGVYTPTHQNTQLVTTHEHSRARRTFLSDDPSSGVYLVGGRSCNTDDTKPTAHGTQIRTKKRTHNLHMSTRTQT